MKYYNFSGLDFFSTQNKFKKNSQIPTHILYGTAKDVELTIVIPVYKRTDFIAGAIQSALNQKTNHRFQVLVLDNTTENDDIRHIVEGFLDDRVAYGKNEKNIGMFGNWNRCFELVKSPWVTMLHDDDRLKPEYVETMFQTLNTYSNLPVVEIGVAHDYINELNQITTYAEIDNSIKVVGAQDFFFDINSIHICGAFFNRDAVIRLGGFDDSFYPASDSNLICKLAVSGIAIKVSKRLSEYRIAQNESLNPSTMGGCVSYMYTQMHVLYTTCNLELPYWFYRIALNVTINNAKKSIETFWGGLDIDYKKIDADIHYREPSKFDSFLYRLVRKFYTDGKFCKINIFHPIFKINCLLERRQK